MPLPKPKKDESQSDFIGRCMSEAYGSDAPSDRTQEQAVAMCHQAWRDKDKAMHTKGPLDAADLPSPDVDESQAEFMQRCVDEVSNEYTDLDEDTIINACDEAWNETRPEGGDEEAHKPEHTRAKVKAEDDEMPTVDDCPEPEDDEAEDDYVERCVSSLQDEFADVAAGDLEDVCRDAHAYIKSGGKRKVKGKQMTTKQDMFTLDDCPEPDQDEDENEYLDRCVEELVSGEDADEDMTNEAEVVCSEKWADTERNSAKPEHVRARKRKGISKKQDAPPVNEGEDEDDYMDRCLEEMTTDQPDMTEEEITAECQGEWQVFLDEGEDEYFGRAFKRQRNKPGVTIFRTHAERIDGMNFVLSDETPDRMGEVLTSTGWDLSNFKKNPIALFAHRSDFPVGRWRDLKVEDGRLRGKLEMAPAGTSARIDEVRKLVEAGILKAVSVGFKALRKEGMDEKSDPYFGPFRYLSQELVECSLVAVPANPNALAVAKSLNISPVTMKAVFAGLGRKDSLKRREFSGGSAKSRVTKGGRPMSLAQRIIELQNQIVAKTDELNKHLEKQDDSNVSDTDLDKTTTLNSQIAQLNKTHASLVESEKHLAAKTEKEKPDRRLPAIVAARRNGKANGSEPPLTSTIGKKDLDLLDLVVRGGTIAYVAKTQGKDVHETRIRYYGDDEPTKFMTDLVLRAASAPAMTSVTGWAAELVQQTYVAMMDTLMPKGILTRLAAKGLSLSFGRAGKINIPTRSRTPSIAGSFVGEGQAIPVRQGAFTSQALTPKKMAVITTWTREMDEHSIPAIEGILREAIQVDTTVAVDSVLIDSGAATTIRPAGLLNGIAAQTPTAGGGIASVVGDLKLLIGALTTATFGNIRSPVWLMNPGEMLSLSLISAANTGIFPFAAEVAAGNLRGVPIIDSGTIPSKTVILIDAADFVVVGGEAPRFEISDQATLHMEDTAPADLVSGSPGTVASPQRSLFQTDSLALRMVMPLNWVQRRTGTISWVQNVTW
jgi:HK97 family phage major capsid protein/HK97 family phage prohead protease